MKNKLKYSLRSAINGMCKSCIFDPLQKGTWRRQIDLCTVQDCSLYPVRPTSGYANPKENNNLETGDKND